MQLTMYTVYGLGPDNFFHPFYSLILEKCAYYSHKKSAQKCDYKNKIKTQSQAEFSLL